MTSAPLDGVAEGPLFRIRWSDALARAPSGGTEPTGDRRMILWCILYVSICWSPVGVRPGIDGSRKRITNNHLADSPSATAADAAHGRFRGLLLPAVRPSVGHRTPAVRPSVGHPLGVPVRYLLYTPWDVPTWYILASLASMRPNRGLLPPDPDGTDRRAPVVYRYATVREQSIRTVLGSSAPNPC